MVLKRTKYDLNLILIPESILSHILGYVGLEQNGIKEVCHRFHNCRIIIPHIKFLISDAHARKFICNNVNKHVMKKCVNKLTYFRCGNIVPDDLRFMATFNSITDLEFNDCTGISEDMMKIVGRMENLRALKLRHCMTVTDALVCHLRDNKKLEKLDLSFCEVRGTTLSYLKGLTDLNLWGCTDIDVGCISKLIRLKKLGLICDDESYVDCVGNLVNLCELNFGYRKMGTKVGGYGDGNGNGNENKNPLINLRKLVIYQMNSAIIFRGRELRYLELWNCKFDVQEWKAVGQLVSLEILDVLNSGLTNEIANELARNLINLRSLHLFMCKGVNLIHFLGIGGGKLETLCIDDGSNAQSVSGFLNLRKLNIKHCKLDNFFVKSIVELNNLNELILCYVDVTIENMCLLRSCGFRIVEEYVFVVPE